MIFKVATFLSRIGSFMICTHDLTVLTPKKEIIHYCESFGYGGKNALTDISNDLTHVCVLAEEGSQQLATFTHTPSEPILLYPLQVLHVTHKQRKSS
jgi:hypothetical protein